MCVSCSERLKALLGLAQTALLGSYRCSHTQAITSPRVQVGKLRYYLCRVRRQNGVHEVGLVGVGCQPPPSVPVVQVYQGLGQDLLKDHLAKLERVLI